MAPGAGRERRQEVSGGAVGRGRGTAPRAALRGAERAARDGRRRAARAFRSSLCSARRDRGGTLGGATCGGRGARRGAALPSRFAPVPRLSLREAERGRVRSAGKLWSRAEPPPARGAGAMPGREAELRGALCLGLLLHALLGCGSAQPPAACPAPCECSEAAKTVKCVNKNLTEVPPDLPPYVRNLFITGNRLGRLPAGALSAPRLAELGSLNLSGNHLRAVEAGALAALPALRQLDLGGNPLAELSPLAFGRASPLEELALRGALREQGALLGLADLLQAGALRNLSRLELADNGLLLLPTGMLGALPALRHLDLSNNSLVGLRNVSFQGLVRLQSLNLSDNSLGVLRNGTLAQWRGLPALRRISLSHNTWVCDCAIEDMVAWLKESDQVEGKEALSCAFPEKMAGRALLKLNTSELNCSAPVDVPSQLQTSYVFLGIVLALIGAIFLLVLYLNRKGIKKWMHNIRDACRDHMEGYHYRYEINADPRLTNLSSNSDV